MGNRVQEKLSPRNSMEIGPMQGWTWELTNTRALGSDVLTEQSQVPKAGRPRGSKNHNPKPRRINKSTNGVVNIPREIVFNWTLKPLDLKVYSLIVALEYKMGWCYASQRGLARLVRDNPHEKYYVQIGKSLYRLLEAGYIERRYKRGEKGIRHEHRTTDLWDHKKKIPRPIQLWQNYCENLIDYSTLLREFSSEMGKKVTRVEKLYTGEWNILFEDGTKWEPEIE